MGGGGPIMKVEHLRLHQPIRSGNGPWNFKWRPLLCSCGDSLGGGEFHWHFAFILDDCFCGFRHLIVKDVFLWYYAGSLQSRHQHSICLGEFVVAFASDGFDQDHIAVYFDHDHDVFVAMLGLRGKSACLVKKYWFAFVVYSCQYISHFLARELWCGWFFERGLWCLFPCCGFGFGWLHILLCLIHVTFWGFCSFWVIFFDVPFREERPTHEIAWFYYLEPCSSVALDMLHWVLCSVLRIASIRPRGHHNGPTEVHLLVNTAFFAWRNCS